MDHRELERRRCSPGPFSRLGTSEFSRCNAMNPPVTCRYRHCGTSLSSARPTSNGSYPTIGAPSRGSWVGRVRSRIRRVSGPRSWRCSPCWQKNRHSLSSSTICIGPIQRRSRPFHSPFDGLTTNVPSFSRLPVRVNLDPLDSMPTLSVVGLSPFEVSQLFEGVLEPGVSEALTLATDGNPLAINEIVDRLTTAQREGQEPLPTFVPIGELLQQAFAARAADLSQDQRRFLLYVAADSRVTIGELGIATGTEDPEKSISLLCERGLIVQLASGRLEFTHPLMRSATYLSAADAARRQAHRDLAGAVPALDISRRAWHLAYGAVGADEAAAVELDAAAEYALEYGDALGAGKSLTRAAELSRGDSRTGRLVRAGIAFSRAGAIPQALGVFDQAMAITPDPLQRADIELLRAIPYLFAFGPAQLQESLVALGAQLLELDTGRSAMADVLAALISFSCSRMNEVQPLCQRALRAEDDPAGAMGQLAKLLCAFAQVLGGEVNRPRSALLERAQRICKEPSEVEMSTGAFLAESLMWTGDWAMASRVISTLIRQCHERGEVVGLAHLLASRSDFNFQTGKWAAALADGAKSEELARESNQLVLTEYALFRRARVEAGLGRAEEASRHVNEAFEIASEAGCLLEAVNSSIGFVALAAGRIPQAIEAFEEAKDISEREGLNLISAFPWAADLVEAYLRAGSPEKAEEIVRGLKSSAAEGDLPLALRTRCEALVADADYEDLFLQSLSHGAGAGAPFETARTQLAYGERLRRVGRRKDAIVQFEQAHEIFRQLQARPWLHRSERELAACGRVRTEEDSTFTELTIQELQVAVTVASGATSREAAAELFLSPRTVEYHLQQVYRKLGIRSRAELARLLGSVDGPRA